MTRHALSSSESHKHSLTCQIKKLCLFLSCVQFLMNHVLLCTWKRPKKIYSQEGNTSPWVWMIQTLKNILKMTCIPYIFPILCGKFTKWGLSCQQFEWPSVSHHTQRADSPLSSVLWRPQLVTSGTFCCANHNFLQFYWHSCWKKNNKRISFFFLSLFMFILNQTKTK